VEDERKHFDGNDNEHMDDSDLLHRESSERREYNRLLNREPHLGDTNYRTLLGSELLMRAWQRWSETRIAAKLRGLKLKP
jgi:hypothetical protein